MTLLQAFILGIVQGLTEFLPISSSGHLVIGQHLFGLRHADLAFDVSVHMGTLGAVVIYFRRDIGTLVQSLLRWRSSAPQASMSADRPDIDARLAVLIFWGSIPTALIGLVLKRYEATLFASPQIVGAMLIVTGCVLYLTRRPQISAQNDPGSMRPMGTITLRDSLLMGTIQGLAVMPGISRSGTTIAAGLFAGLAPQAAARFSFLLSIPAVAGAALLVLTDALAQGQVKPAPCLVGGLTALVVGYAALAILVYLIGRGKLFTFAPYCWMAGIAAIAVGW